MKFKFYGARNLVNKTTRTIIIPILVTTLVLIYILGAKAVFH